MIMPKSAKNRNPENWGSPTEPQSVPVVAGTPQTALDDVIIFPFNDIERTISLLDRHAERAGMRVD